jgi:hypothetical protein
MTDDHEDDTTLISALHKVRESAQRCFEHYDNQERTGGLAGKAIARHRRVKATNYSRYGDASQIQERIKPLFRVKTASAKFKLPIT